MNTGYNDMVQIRELFSKLTGIKVDETFWLRPPFYTDFGRNIRIRKNVFINHCCEFMDRGCITIEDDVIRKNAWIGVAASVMPGVTIGENSIAASNALVTKYVPTNTVVAGIPAKVLKRIDEDRNEQ